MQSDHASSESSGTSQDWELSQQPSKRRYLGVFAVGIILGSIVPYIVRSLHAEHDSPSFWLRPVRWVQESLSPIASVFSQSEKANRPQSVVHTKSKLVKKTTTEQLSARVSVKTEEPKLANEPAATEQVSGKARSIAQELKNMSSAKERKSQVATPGSKTEKTAETKNPIKRTNSLAKSSDASGKTDSVSAVKADPKPTAAPQAKLVMAPVKNANVQARIAASSGPDKQSPDPLKTEEKSPRSASKTYALVINNAKYAKERLDSCPKRCLLTVVDANGSKVKAIIPGDAYAKSLINHNGTINLSGEPRLVKDQQVLMVKSISFNLSPSALASLPPAAAPANANFKAVRYRQVMPSRAAAVPVTNSAPMYAEDGDLRPGAVIQNRKQIPMNDSDEEDMGDTRLESLPQP